MTPVSRPPTPDSPSSLRHATTTIDQLTTALSNSCHAMSPEPPGVSTCCCGRDDCEHSRCWAAFRAKLEERLVLSAEVGQALLERHEAYVRRHEQVQPTSSSSASLESRDLDIELRGVDDRVAELVKRNAILEKRLSQALVNNEVSDVAHQKALEELKDAKDKISQLSAQNARLIGVDTRLAHALQEKDDMQQERNSAAQRAKTAETRVVSLKEKCAKLQAQVTRLREDLEVQRSYRKEMSEEILTEARDRLQHLQQLNIGSSGAGDDNEVTKVLESLVGDNEALKHDNAELQNLLVEAREDLRVLQEEVDEHRADTSYSRHRRGNESIGSSVFNDQHSPSSPTFHIGTAPASSMMHTMFNRQYSTPSFSRRPASLERELKRGIEPLTPEMNLRSSSPTDSTLASGSRWSSLRPQTHYAPSHLSLKMDEHADEQSLPIPRDGPRPPKSLLLLTKSRAIQTDGTGAAAHVLDPSAIPRAGDNSQDGQSESSSLADNSTTVIGVLVERVSTLLNRLTQADALTLTTRLKRQHLLGADVSHLSRTTVSTILNESNALRAQFRAFLEDDKITSTCTRRDLRALFKLFKDVFSEMGQLRVTLNDVILDPTVAGKVSQMALHPSKTGPNANTDGSTGTTSSTPAWMVPLTKFLGLPVGAGADDAAARALSPPVRPSTRVLARPPNRIVPKREAALAASTVAVNVEFTGAGVGRAVASSGSNNRASSDISMLTASASSASQLAAATVTEPSRSVMDIFAGAPRAVDLADPWVVVPKPRRAGTTGIPYTISGSATIGRSAARSTSIANLRQASNNSAGPRVMGRKLSRNLDAIIDTPQSPDTDDADEASDIVSSTLLERTLRPRGLSDSSIHTTFMGHANEGDLASEKPAQTESPKPDRQSVLQALGRKVQSFRLASSPFAAPTRPHNLAGPSFQTSSSSTDINAAPLTEPLGQETDIPGTIRKSDLERAASPGSGLFQSLTFSSWAAMPDSDPMGEETEPGRPGGPFYVGTVREESVSSRAWSRGRDSEI